MRHVNQWLGDRIWVFFSTCNPVATPRSLPLRLTDDTDRQTTQWGRVTSQTDGPFRQENHTSGWSTLIYWQSPPNDETPPDEAYRLSKHPECQNSVRRSTQNNETHTGWRNAYRLTKRIQADRAHRSTDSTCLCAPSVSMVCLSV